MKIQIDFIIPTIPPREHYLKRCLTAINNLAVPSGIEIVKNPIVISEKKSAGAQRNIALARSTGDYIYFIDDDDIVLHNFFCSRMIENLTSGSLAVFFASERYFQPSEDDMHHMVPDNFMWAVGRTIRTTTELANIITPSFNPYPVGSYILHKSFKDIRWPEAYTFGEDLGYNKMVCVSLSKKVRQLTYIDEVKHITVRHALSTTYAGKGKDMTLWQNQR